jgi:hypothetical protein
MGFRISIEAEGSGIVGEFNVAQRSLDENKLQTLAIGYYSQGKPVEIKVETDPESYADEVARSLRDGLRCHLQRMGFRSEIRVEDSQEKGSNSSKSTIKLIP